MILRILRPALLSLCLAASAVALTATPSQAGLIGCILLGNCSGGSEPTPDVPATGVIHPVFIAGDTFFPNKIHAKLGDEVKFYNLTNGSFRVEATDNSWRSTSMSKNKSWSIILQEDVSRNFQKDSYYSSSMRGSITLDELPASVDFGDLIDGYGNIIGKDGSQEAVARGLGKTLASVGGLVQNVGDVVGGLVGNGNGNGLTDDYGIGNNGT